LGDRPIILLYTRFFEFRVQRAIEILGRVATAMPEVALLVVGRGLFGEERQLVTLAEEAGLTRWLVYAGWVEPEALSDYFAAADVAIYPFDDTLVNRTKCSVKLIELLAAELPVVADAVGQNVEYIEHEVSGILVAPGDTEAFTSAVLRLLQDPALRRSLGRAARARLEQHFAWEHLAMQAEAAYQRNRQKREME
jgi:glycosyltransferase involved in cell wall biosynthesis